MRIIPAAISFTLFSLLLPQIAAAQNEIVTVTAESLAGPWKITLPSWGAIDISMVAKFGPMTENFCRMEGGRSDMHVSCLRRFGSTLGNGTLSLDGNKIHIAWGSMLLRQTIDATLQSPGVFSGSYALKLTGITVTAPSQLTASKIDLSSVPPDAGGKSALLKKQLVDLGNGVPFTLQPYMSKDMSPPEPDDLRKLGGIQAVLYLGRTQTTVEEGRPGMDRQPPPESQAPPYNNDAFEIYAVEFDHGERICGIRQRPDGVVDGLHCV